MSVPQLLPPSDLLEQVQGIEQGLLRRRRLHWLGLLLAAAQVTILLLNSAWLQALFSADWSAVADQWWLIAVLFALVVSVFLASWTRFWLKESRQPFRYTFSMTPFDAVTEEDADTRMRSLQTDLLEKLSRRVGRLSLRAEDEGHTTSKEGPGDTSDQDGGPAPSGASHIHVSGYYAKRQRRPDPYWAVEVTEWVRVGGSTYAATLAPSVKYPIRQATGDQPPALDGQQYEEVLERAYSSVATAIYEQIQQDVARKIDLLPSRYFRAAAYFYEAEDYARSNTLEAYDRALELYDAALKRYDPNWKSAYRARIRRPLRRVRQILALALQRVRRAASHIVPRVGKIEVLAARAQIGYANTLVYRRILAGLAGGRVNPIFEACPVAQRAVKRLCQLADDVPGRQQSLFDAYVARALALSQMGRVDDAERDLSRARAHDPYRAEQDPRLLFVSGLMEVEVLTALPRLRRAVEFDPHFEAAQFQLAYNLEILWRLRPDLEENVAEMVFDQYESVLRLNPGNVSSWANLGYMHWLLADKGERDDAKKTDPKKKLGHAALARNAFESGRQYKEIKHEAFVGELDHGLTRIAAENGRFREAYRHYVNAVAAIVTQGRSGYLESYTKHQLHGINEKMLGRFTEYRDAVQAAWKNPSPDEARATTPRVRDSVYSFALNDFAEASYRYYLRSGDLEALDAAYDALIEATQDLNTSYVVTYVNLNRVEQARSDALEFFADGDPGGWALDYVDRREPAWPEGNLLSLVRCTERGRRAQSEASELRRRAAELRKEAQETRRRALGSATPPWLPDSGIGEPVTTDFSQIRGDDAADELAHRTREIDLEEQALELENQASTLKDEAGRRERRARELTIKLLPHDWLWKAAVTVDEGDDGPPEGDDGPPEAELELRSLTRKDYERELKWERSFDDFHVRALFSWCQRRRLAADNVGRHSVEQVLDLIEERFWPNHFDLLRERRDESVDIDEPTAPRRIGLRRPTSRPRGNDRERAIRDTLLRSHREDPDAYQALRALGDKAIPPATRREHYIVAAAKIGRPPDLYKWLGDRLLSLGAYEEGLAAYESAAQTNHAATLLELGQQFDAVGQRETALGCLRRAMKSADPALLISVSQALSQLGALEEALKCLDRAKATDEPSLLSEIAAGFEEAGRWDACAETYRRAAEQDRRRAAPSHGQAFYRLHIGRSLWHSGAQGHAVRELMGVSEGGEVPSRWRTSLVEELSSPQSLTSEPGYFLLRSWLLSDQRVGPPQVRADAGAALLSVAASAYPALRGPDSVEWDEVPSRRPIVLQADSRFFGQRKETPAVVRMIETDIPAMRERIRIERGAYMPGVQIEGPEDFGRREYRLLLHEVVLEYGRVPRAVADPYRYMLDRLERLVRANLATFVDVQIVENLLAEWESDAFGEREALRVRALPEIGSLRRFVQIVEGLVLEQVPIVDFETMLRSCEGFDLSATPLHEAVDGVRLALREQLPGLDGRPLVPLPEDVEAALTDSWERHGRASVGFRMDDLEKLRALVRKRARRESETFAFLVQDAALRFFANRLVEMDCPSVPVVSAREAERGREHGLRISPAELLSRVR